MRRAPRQFPKLWCTQHTQQRKLLLIQQGSCCQAYVGPIYWRNHHNPRWGSSGKSASIGEREREEAGLARLSPYTGVFAAPTLVFLQPLHWCFCSPYTGVFAAPTLVFLQPIHWCFCSPYTGIFAARGGAEAVHLMGENGGTKDESIQS